MSFIHCAHSNLPFAILFVIMFSDTSDTSVNFDFFLSVSLVRMARNQKIGKVPIKINWTSRFNIMKHLFLFMFFVLVLGFFFFFGCWNVRQDSAKSTFLFRLWCVIVLLWTIWIETTLKLKQRKAANRETAVYSFNSRVICLSTVRLCIMDYVEEVGFSF